MAVLQVLLEDFRRARSVAKFNRIYFEAQATKRLGLLFDLFSTVPGLVSMLVKRSRMAQPRPAPISGTESPRGSWITRLDAARSCVGFDVLNDIRLRAQNH